MEAIWSLDQAVTVRDVLESPCFQVPKAYTTIQTVMNHLVTKGFLTRSKVGPVNSYQACLAREEDTARQVQQFVASVFSGSAGSLASYLVGEKLLSENEISLLRQTLDQLAEQRSAVRHD